MQDWMWRGTVSPTTASIDAVVANPASHSGLALRYRLAFAAVGQRFELEDERIKNERPHAGQKGPFGRHAALFRSAGRSTPPEPRARPACDIWRRTPSRSGSRSTPSASSGAWESSGESGGNRDPASTSRAAATHVREKPRSRRESATA